MPRGVPVHHRGAGGKFVAGDPDRKLMPAVTAIEILGNPPKTWERYTHAEAAWALYRHGLATLAQRRENGAMVMLWKARA